MLAKIKTILFPPTDWRETLAYQKRLERTKAWQYRIIPQIDKVSCKRTS